MLSAILAQTTFHDRAGSLARALLKAFGTFAKTINARLEDLIDVEGMDVAAVTALKTARSAALHLLRTTVTKGPILYSMDNLVDYLTATLKHERVRVSIIVFLDVSYRVIADEELSRGTINHVATYPREIIRRCLELDAGSIIMARNDPSGTLAPSHADVMATKDLLRATQMMGIGMLDHIIIDNRKYYSFSQNKLL